MLVKIKVLILIYQYQKKNVQMELRENNLFHYLTIQKVINLLLVIQNLLIQFKLKIQLIV